MRGLVVILGCTLVACGQTALQVEAPAPIEAEVAELRAPQEAAAQSDSWSCTYMGYAIRENETPRPVIVRFTVDGDELIERRFGLRYRILQNNEHALIAAWSIAEVEPNRTEPSIATTAIAIDKRNGFFSRVNLIARPGESGSARDGSCIRD